jgi:hypothetical protein
MVNTEVAKLTPTATPTPIATPTPTATPTPDLVTTGLVIWLKADAIMDLSDGDPVGVWPDLSGNGNDARQSISGRKPTYKTSISNDKPGLRFDGVDDGLIIVDDPSYKSSQIHLFLVCRSFSPQRAVIGYPHASTHVDPWFRWVFFHSSATPDGINIRIDINDVNAGETRVNNRWEIFSIYSYDTKLRDIYVNGLLFFDGAGRPITYPNATGLRIGFDADGTENLNGDIAEIILYNRTLSDPERQQVEQYLSNKYGIPVASNSQR